MYNKVPMIIIPLPTINYNGYCQAICITPWIIAQYQSMPLNIDQNYSIESNTNLC